MNNKILSHQFTRDTVAIEPYEVAHEGFFSLRKIRYRYPKFNGGVSNLLQHEVMYRPPAVVVLPYDVRRDEIVLIEQIRSGVVAVDGREPWLYEVVAGLLESSDSPVSGGERELLEETGLQAQAWETVGQYWVSPGGSTEEVFAFCALVDSTHAGGVHGVSTENENIRVQVFPYDVLLGQLKAGAINNSATIICLQWLAMHKAQLQKMWSKIPPKE